MRSARLGSVVPKKGTAKAHRRNRIKRIIRNSFRLHAEQLPAVDIVVQVFGAVDDEQLARQLEKQWRKICSHKEFQPKTPRSP